MSELNPTQGDSNQEGAQQPVHTHQPVPQEPVEEPIVEPAQPIEQPAESEVDKVLNNQEFVDKFFAKFGDGVKTVIDNQVQKRVEETLENVNVSSQENPGKPVEEAAPEKVKPQTDLEKPKEQTSNNELEVLKEKVAQMESGSVENAIRNIPEIKQLSEYDSSEAERFIGRAKNIATANNISASEVSRIFAEGSDIKKDVSNQLAILTQGNTNLVNKPINKPLNIDTTPKPDKKAEIIKAFMSGK